jgi:ABC-type lipoprotein export system ATPase subunit
MIRLRHIERFYLLANARFFYVLRDINIDIEEGELVSIMRLSGAGKSTLLHVLRMHDHGWTGEYFVNDAAAHHLKAKERTTLRYRGCLFHPLLMGTLETDKPRQVDARFSTRCEVARGGDVQARHIDRR